MNNVRLLKRVRCLTIQGWSSEQDCAITPYLLWASLLNLISDLFLVFLLFSINSTPMPHGLCTCCFCTCILYSSHQPILYSKAIYSEKLSLTTIKIPQPVLFSPLILICFFFHYTCHLKEKGLYICLHVCYMLPLSRTFLLVIPCDLSSRETLSGIE